MSEVSLSIRVNGGNPDHHLWDNHGTWFVHYTLHLPDHTKRRVRRSLGTGSLKEARRRRDELIGSLSGALGAGVVRSLPP